VQPDGHGPVWFHDDASLCSIFFTIAHTAGLSHL
jgi:hypothetical protein